MFPHRNTKGLRFLTTLLLATCFPKVPTLAVKIEIVKDTVQAFRADTHWLVDADSMAKLTSRKTLWEPVHKWNSKLKQIQIWDKGQAVSISNPGSTPHMVRFGSSGEGYFVGPYSTETFIRKSDQDFKDYSMHPITDEFAIRYVE